MWLCPSPEKGRLSENVPEQNEVEQAKKARDQAEQEARPASGDLSAVCAPSWLQGMAALGENPPDEEEAKAQLSSLEQQLKDEKEKVKKAQDHYRKCVEETRRRAGPA